MARWTCPRCDREFARARQGHTCVPGCTVDETFAGRPATYRAIYDAVIGYLRSLGPVHADAVSVGVFLKRERKLAEVRPYVRSLSVELYLPRELDHPRVVRRYPVSAGRTVHVFRLTRPDEVDDQVRDWLTEAFLAAGE